MEECDSTWGSDSESDEPAADDDSGISESVSPAEHERAAGDASPQVRRTCCDTAGVTAGAMVVVVVVRRGGARSV